MSVTRSGPSSSTHPFDRVDLPAPESPTRHNMMGRPARNGIMYLRSPSSRLREIIHKHDRLRRRLAPPAFGLVPSGGATGSPGLTCRRTTPAASLRALALPGGASRWLLVLQLPSQLQIARIVRTAAAAERHSFEGGVAPPERGLRGGVRGRYPVRCL